MHTLLVAWLIGNTVLATPAGVDIGGSFGRAEASGTQISSSQIELRLSVEAEPGEAVIAHLIEPGGEQQALPIPEVSAGVYRIVVDARKINYIVVFELLRSGAEIQSEPYLLTELGVEPAVLGISLTAPNEIDEPNPANSWGWAGLGFAALSLLALAVWAWPSKAEAKSNIAKTEPVDTL